MENAFSNTAKSQRAFIKAATLLVFFMAAGVVLRFTPVRNYLTVEQLGAFLNSSGLLAPVVYISVYAVGECLFLPGTLLSGLGAAIFGPYWGFLCVWIAAVLGSSGAFFIARTMAREYATSLIGDRLKKYDDSFERNGFRTVLCLRLAYFPFTPMNFGMGVTKIRFEDYFMGTALGIIVGTFIFSFFIGTLKEAWASGRWEELISVRVFFSIALFGFSLFMPKLIKKFRKENHKTWPTTPHT